MRSMKSRRVLWYISARAGSNGPRWHCGGQPNLNPHVCLRPSQLWRCTTVHADALWNERHTRRPAPQSATHRT